MRIWKAIFLSAALLTLPSFGQQPIVYKGKDEKLPQQVAPQPILFSHLRHTAAGIKCLDCHPGADKRERAGLPQADQCMLCHQTIAADSAQIKKLAEKQKANEKIDWVRVYHVPGFVFFSHVNHTKAGLECETCHGPVQQRQVLAKEVSTSMTTCMNCHAARQVPNHCQFCHSLGQ
jgi:Cytochrome c3/Cytochrome c7 and related cytochrome c